VSKEQIDVTIQISKYIIDYLEKNKPDEHAVIIALIGVYFGSVEAVVRDYRKNGLSENDINIFIDDSLKLLEESKQKIIEIKENKTRNE
jgi:undecaprenyl pyrophosphate synthase